MINLVKRVHFFNRCEDLLDIPIRTHICMSQIRLRISPSQSQDKMAAFSQGGFCETFFANCNHPHPLWCSGVKLLKISRKLALKRRKSFFFIYIHTFICGVQL